MLVPMHQDELTYDVLWQINVRTKNNYWPCVRQNRLTIQNGRNELLLQM